MDEKYTLQFKQVGDHLQVIIAELGITAETEAGKVSRDDGFDVAHREIERWYMAKRERQQQHTKAS